MLDTNNQALNLKTKITMHLLCEQFPKLLSTKQIFLQMKVGTFEWDGLESWFLDE